MLAVVLDHPVLRRPPLPRFLFELRLLRCLFLFDRRLFFLALLLGAATAGGQP